MKKTLFFLVISFFLFSLLLWAPLLLWANVYELYTVKKIPGAFYFTPAVSSKEYAIFGYVSKITPTPEELEAERKRINAIIDGAVKEGYGSWENFEKEMEKAGEGAAQKESKEAPSWVKSLLPPSLIKNAVPLLMKGALLYAKTHPEASTEPIGNVGETGIVIVDEWGNVTKIPLGLNAPVSSIAVSPDGKMAAVLTDMSFEDEKGYLHVLGEISFIDLTTKTRIYSRIFANLAGHIAFVPGTPVDTYWLAFDYYTDMKDFGKKDVRIFDFKTKEILKYCYHTYGNASASIFGKRVSYPNFIFGLDPAVPHMPIIALYQNGFFELYDVMTGKKLVKVLTNGHTLVFANHHPWVFTGIGELWDYKSANLLSSVKVAFGKSFPAIDAKFTENDLSVIYVEAFGCPKEFDITSKTITKSCDFYSRGGLFFLTPDERFMVAFIEGKGMATYQNRYLRREKLCLRIIDTQNLRARQDICIENSTVVDAGMAESTLIVSDFDKLYIFKPFKKGVWY